MITVMMPSLRLGSFAAKPKTLPMMTKPLSVFSLGVAMFAITFAISGCDKDDDDNNATAPVTDVDGNAYATVRIGDQVWMKENLNVTHYNDGDPIALVTQGELWKDLSTPGYCWYDNDPEVSGSIYGALYNWHAVETGKLCPTGWHVPSREEWDVLINRYGGVNSAGGALKATGTTYWNAPNAGATNESGFTALPGGARSRVDGAFGNQGNYAYFWTSSDDYVYTAWPKIISHSTIDMFSSFADRKSGMSVRCVKD
jgi:uncharacterized protein (TIGR02145 family)